MRATTYTVAVAHPESGEESVRYYDAASPEEAAGRARAEQWMIREVRDPAGVVVWPPDKAAGRSAQYLEIIAMSPLIREPKTTIVAALLIAWVIASLIGGALAMVVWAAISTG